MTLYERSKSGRDRETGALNINPDTHVTHQDQAGRYSSEHPSIRAWYRRSYHVSKTRSQRDCVSTPRPSAVHT